VVADAKGYTRTYLVPQRRPVFTGRDNLMIWTTNSRIDWTAHDVYRDARLWWVIADANPKIDDWDRVDPGTVVRLPDVTVID
jgi:hypothetical protein